MSRLGIFVCVLWYICIIYQVVCAFVVILCELVSTFDCLYIPIDTSNRLAFFAFCYLLVFMFMKYKRDFVLRSLDNNPSQEHTLLHAIATIFMLIYMIASVAIHCEFLHRVPYPYTNNTSYDHVRLERWRGVYNYSCDVYPSTSCPLYKYVVYTSWLWVLKIYTLMSLLKTSASGVFPKHVHTMQVIKNAAGFLYPFGVSRSSCD